MLAVFFRAFPSFFTLVAVLSERFKKKQTSSQKGLQK